jgi:hypothetical protein
MTLLGPQRLTPTLPEAVAAAGVDLSAGQPPLAVVTAGWQEREDDDADLVAALLGNTVNLRLYARVADIFERDPELARAHSERGRLLQDIQSLYDVRLANAMDAVYELLRQTTGTWLLDDEVESALETVRALDDRVLALNAEVTAEFLATWRPAERDLVAAHRGQVASLLSQASGLAIAGGQVPTLLNRLNLLGVAEHVQDLHVFAWSAGAMVVTERIVVFHDDPAHGRPHARVFEVGLGWCKGVVALPHARRRLHLHDARRVSLLARRFAPAACLGLEDGAEYPVVGSIGDVVAGPVDGGVDAPVRPRRHGILHLGVDGVVAELAA